MEFWRYIAIGLGVVIVIGAFVWWRYTSVERGARRRDEKILKLLDPVGEKLTAREQISPDEVATLAAQPHVRPMLYGTLKFFERLDLFPKQYLDVKSQGEAQLAYWMLHPNELDAVPESMEFVESVTRSDGQGQVAEFLVFRYKMGPGHRAGKDGWLLGLAGPFLKDDIPYSAITSGFSRCGDKYGEIKPSELVDWFIEMVGSKS